MEYFHTNDGFILSVLFLLMSAYGTPVNALVFAETHAKILCRDDAYFDCKLADDAHNICAIRTLAAVKLCPKYCGFCTADGSTLPPPTGTTIDTCIDSGDIDCKQMNDTLHVCAKKDSLPALLYCPKFCGSCTSPSNGNVTHHVTTTVSSGSSKITDSGSCKDEIYMDCKLADDTHNICAERSLAAIKYCPKYCGFCSAVGSTLPPPIGTTIDTCIDDGDIDCKQMNDTLNICAKKDSSPTLLYCPKFCGLCTSPSKGNVTHHVTTTVSSGSSTVGSTLPPPIGTTIDTCIDDGDIDCKQMNDTLNICAKKDSSPTLLYCPKFCGLCMPSDGGNTKSASTSTGSQTTQTKTTQMTTKSSTIQSTTTSPPPKTLPPTTTQCAVCSGPPFLCEKRFQPTACTPPNNYCINTITNKLDGTKTVNRACGDFNTCYREWYLGTSDEDKCRNFDANDQQFIDFRCTFCCISDNCNIPLRPLNSDLYKPV